MGLIVDSSVLITGERRGVSVRRIIARLQGVHGNVECAMSAMSIIELTHGIYRAKTDADRIRRKMFTEELARDMVVHLNSRDCAAGRANRGRASRNRKYDRNSGFGYRCNGAACRLWCCDRQRSPFPKYSRAQRSSRVTAESPTRASRTHQIVGRLWNGEGSRGYFRGIVVTELGIQ